MYFIQKKKKFGEELIAYFLLLGHGMHTKRKNWWGYRDIQTTR
jgi:hypothetical protein